MELNQAQTIARKDTKLVWAIYLPRVQGKAKHLPNLICAVIDSAMGERVPVQKLADMLGRTRRRVAQVVRQLEAAGLIVDGLVDKAAWLAWAGTDHYDRLPACLLGRLGSDLSPGLLSECAVLFGEAMRDSGFIRSDRERAELVGVSRTTVAAAHEVLDRFGLVRRERQWVQLRQGKKRLHKVRPPSQAIRVVQGLGHRRATLKAWSADAAHGRRGAAAGGSRFATKPATNGQGIQSASQANTDDLLTIATPHSVQPEGSRAAKPATHPHTLQGYPNRPSGLDQTPHKRISSPTHTPLMGSFESGKQMGGLIESLTRKITSRPEDDSERRGRISRIDLRRRRDPKQQIEHILAEAGMWLVPGKRPHPKLEARRWQLAREILEAGVSPAQVLEVVQTAAQDSKIQTVARVLEHRLRRLMTESRTAPSQPGAPATEVRQESPAIAAARRRKLSKSVGAALAGDWKTLASCIEFDRRTDLPISTEQIAEAAGLSLEVITTGLATLRVAAAG